MGHIIIKNELSLLGQDCVCEAVLLADLIEIVQLEPYGFCLAKIECPMMSGTTRPIFPQRRQQHRRLDSELIDQKMHNFFFGGVQLDGIRLGPFLAYLGIDTLSVVDLLIDPHILTMNIPRGVYTSNGV